MQKGGVRLRKIRQLITVLILVTLFGRMPTFANHRLQVTVLGNIVTVSGSLAAPQAHGSCVVLPAGADAGSLDAAAFAGGAQFAGQVTADSAGNFSASFRMPEAAVAGQYTAVVTDDTGRQTHTFAYQPRVYERFYEDFSRGATRWNTNHMGVVNGRLIVKDTSICTATLKGEPAAFWQDQEITVTLSMSDFLNGWFQINFRNDGQSAEKLLLRKNGLTRLLPDGREQSLCRWMLSDGQQYVLNISAVGDAVDIQFSDLLGERLAAAQYGDAVVQTGTIGFASFNQNAAVASVAVKDTSEGWKMAGVSVDMTTGETVAMDVETIEPLVWSSETPSVATVDENGVITAVEPGTATIAASSGERTVRCTVVVTRSFSGMQLSEADCTLYVGENISLSAQIPAGTDASALLWSSSNPQIAALFGSGYTGRTVCAKQEGTAIIQAYSATDGTSAQCRVRVIADHRVPQIAEAMFAASDAGIEISKRKFGTAHEYSNRRPTAEAALLDIGFDFMRTFGVADYDDGFFDLANGAGIPQMVAVPVIGRTTEEILSDVKLIEERLKQNRPLYIELGNEVYDNGYASAEAYMDVCREAYRAIKAYDASILVGAVIIGEEFTVLNPGGKLGKWNEIVAQNPDCYDAVVVHHYITFNSIDGMTQTDMQDTIHLWNAYHQYAVETYAAQFPGKELWVTEYGTFYAAVFRQEDSTEKARMGMGKEFGVSLGNLEQALDLLTSNHVDMCSYHILEDSQGFGMVQGDIKLPNYYIFKEISAILQQNRLAYQIEPMFCKTYEIQSPAIRGGTFFEMQDIKAWGFGDETGMRYAVFLNKSSNPTEIVLKDRQLQKVWQYEGNLFDDYLAHEGRFTDAPTHIALPIEPEETPVKRLRIAGHSAVVCKVSETNPALDAVFSAAAGVWNFEKEQPLTATFSHPIGELSAADVTVEKNGAVQAAQVTKTGERQYYIAPVSGWAFDSQYTITLHSGITALDGQRLADDTRLSFTTPPAPDYTAFTPVFTETFDNGTGSWDCWNWKITGGRLYKQDSGISTAVIKERQFGECTLSFEMELPASQSDGYAAVLFQGGALRFYPHTGIIRSYFHGKNDAPFGTFTAPDGRIFVTIHLYGTKAEVYIQTSADAKERYVGEIPYLDIAADTIAFQGKGQFYLDNITISAATETISKIRCSQTVDGQTIWLQRPTAGSNTIEVWLDSELGEDCTLYAASMADGALCSVAVAEAKNDGRYVLTIEVGEGELVSLFLWNSRMLMTPLDNVRVL